VEETAAPEDTLAAYKTISMIREQAVEGAPFDSLAQEYSEDPSAKSNGGDLGYFTSMQMVYPFETAAYQTDEGDVSPVIRTRFGYHIIKVADKRPAQGSVVVSHIMLRHTPDSTAVENQIFTIHEQAIGGVAWSELVASYSEDSRSRDNEGKLNAFSIGQVPVEFQEASFALQEPGQISDPVMTAYGWHIIRLEEKIPVAPLEELQPAIERRIKQDERALISQEAMINELKQEWDYFKAPQTDSIIFELKDSASWSQLNGQILFNLGDRSFSVAELDSFLGNDKSDFYENPVGGFNDFEAATVLAWEEDHLEDKYPEFRMLLREYREGILYFQLMENEIWKPAGEDSIGISEFYMANREAYKYPAKAQAWVYNVPDSMVMEKLFNAIARNAVSEKEFVLKSNDAGEIVPVKVSWEEGRESSWNDIRMEAGVYKKVMSDKLYIVEVTEVNDGGYKNLDEIRGLVIADYQKQLEERWIEELRLKYEIQRNEEGQKYIYDELVR
jgi:peptidyl-prolyl cis-trans isomerase SurA